MEDEVVVREEGERRRWRTSEFMKESGKVAKVAGPMMLGCLSQILLQFISVVMVGHLGEIPLSTTTIAAVTGFNVLVSHLFLSILFYIYIYLQRRQIQYK
ncbi:hypothetical protein DsansV1_C09g0089101 [Dioscorea sansibarensis]